MRGIPLRRMLASLPPAALPLGILPLAILTLAIAGVAMPAASFAACEDTIPMIHGLDSHFSCDDNTNVAALAYSLAQPTAATTGLEDIACERLFGGPRGDCLSGGVAGDRRVMIQTDWGNPFIEGCPATEMATERVVVVVQGADGQGLVVSIGYNVDMGGYLVEQAHPANLAALACSARSGAPRITSQTPGSGDELILGLHFEVPLVFSDCDPGTVGSALGTCADGFAANPAFGKIYTSVQPCMSNPDLRRGMWTDSGVQPDASGDAALTVTRPAGEACLYVGEAPVIGGVESGAVVGFVAIPGAACGLDQDGDGFTACTGDCDDGNGDVYLGHPELCDGLDNDCDGLIDENLGTVTCGVGACRRTVEMCVDGQPSTCVPRDPLPEVCDEIDNDCNGVADDVPGLGAACDTGYPGECAVGATECSGLLMVCRPTTTVSVEVCDGLDNDCDGLVDDLLGMISCGNGACQNTVAACVDGVPQTCVPGTPEAEVCDAIDNDCNSVVDDILPLPCATGLPGVCGTGSERCSGTATICAATTSPSAEICDGLDNDCDGVVDEGFGQLACGLGDCATSVAACVNGVPQACVPGPGGPEVCDGRDNDCDGSADEALEDGACDTGQAGACAAGTRRCSLGAYQCERDAAPGPELCDGIDNDCDGQVDDQTGYALCGTGACLRAVDQCVGGSSPVCVPGEPSAETCDGIDNDCDGSVDEGLAACSPPLPPCAESVSMRHGMGSYFTCSDASQVAVLAYQLSDPTAVTTAGNDIACESVGNGESGACLSGGRVGDQIVTIQGDWSSPGTTGCPIAEGTGPQRVVVLMQGINGQGLVVSLGGLGQGTGYLVETAHKLVPGAGFVLPLACSAQNGGLRVVSRSTGPGNQESMLLQFTPPLVFSDCDPDSVGWGVGACTDFFSGDAALGDIHQSLQPCGPPPDLRRGLWTDTGIPSGSDAGLPLTVTRPQGTQCLYLGATAFIDGQESGGIFAFTTVLGTACVDQDDDGFSDCQNDCDDANPGIYPGRSEICSDGVDNNCDGLTDDQDTFTCDPLAVVLTSFEAAPADGAVMLTWETALEIDSAGFDLLRRDLLRDTTVTVNPGLIPAAGDPLQGASYRFVDRDAVNGVEYEYLLVEVEISGRRARHPGLRAVANPVRPPVELLAPEYGHATSTMRTVTFAWSGADEDGLVLELSTDPGFAAGGATMSVAISGNERRAGRMTLSRGQARGADEIAGAGDRVVYWRILGRRGGERVPLSATWRIDYR